MKQHKKNLQPQKNSRYSLNDYYDALKFRNFDVENVEEANAMLSTIKEYKKSRRSSSQLGLLKSVLAECLTVQASWNEGKLELTVLSIDVPRDLKEVFVNESEIGV